MIHYKTPYEYPRKLRSCLNCIHLDQPPGKIAGKEIGGCRERLMKFGYAKDDPRFGTTYCEQWYLRPLMLCDFD